VPARAPLPAGVRTKKKMNAGTESFKPLKSLQNWSFPAHFGIAHIHKLFYDN
jgi:hypothetical protein